jgi:hypothetical protein
MAADPTAIWQLPLDAAPKAETKEHVVASRADYYIWDARPSPDERWILFRADPATEAAVHNIYVMPAEGGNWTQITEGKCKDDKPRWSPDGKTIYFMSPRTGFFNLMGIRFDPDRGKPMGEPFPVKAFENPGERVLLDLSQMQLGISEHLFVLPITQVTGNIWVLENVDR